VLGGFVVDIDASGGHEHAQHILESLEELDPLLLTLV
jgi:hypothetical protein